MDAPSHTYHILKRGTQKVHIQNSHLFYHSLCLQPFCMCPAPFKISSKDSDPTECRVSIACRFEMSIHSHSWPMCVHSHGVIAAFISSSQEMDVG